MKIEKGAIAPSFEAMTSAGETLSLADYKGKKVWLAFYRYASCPLCNYRMHELLQRHREFEQAGIQMVAVFHSPPGQIERYVGKQNPPFPIVADPKMELYRLYGVKPNILGLFAMRNFSIAIKALFLGYFSRIPDRMPHVVPADFLIDPEGLVYDAFYGAAVSDHIPFPRVQTFGEDHCLDMPATAASPL